MDKDKKIKELEDRINNCEMVLMEWRKIGRHFIDNSLMVWGDILPLKSLDIIKEMEEENKKLKQIIDAMDTDKRKYRNRANELKGEMERHRKLRDKYEN